VGLEGNGEGLGKEGLEGGGISAEWVGDGNDAIWSQSDGERINVYAGGLQD
jgi:hypothetical protein